MFSKIDKKVLTILITVLVVILLGGFAIYKYMAGSVTNIKNTVGGTETEIQATANPVNSSVNNIK